MFWTDTGDQSLNLPTDALTLSGALHPRECDAHALWACLSDFDGYLDLPDLTGTLPGARMVPVLVELVPMASSAERQAIAQAIRRPTAYDIEENFWTGIVPRADLPALHNLAGVRAWSIGLPVVRDTFAGDAAPAGPSASATAIGSTSPTPLNPAVPVVGIIDHGIAVAHAAFRLGRSSAQPRLIALWDQDPYRCNNQNWQPVADLGYGGELTMSTLAGLIALRDDERRIYELLDYTPVQRPFSHGTHVLDLAVGEPSPLTPPGQTTAQDLKDWSGPASSAGIIAVQLPYKPQKDTSGSSLCVHVLDALHYIVARAPQGRPVVVNLSDGAYGGPHDGHSMLERAVEKFLALNPHVTLVLAAGNAHEDRLHAKSPPLAQGGKHTFQWRVLPDDATLTFAEIWFDRELDAGDVSVRVAPPSGGSPVTAMLGGPPKLLIHPGCGVAGSVIGRRSNPSNYEPGGQARSMFLIALAPTVRQRTGRPLVPHGVWTLAVENHGPKNDVHVDAWIERDNPALNDRGPSRQSYFEDDHCNPLSVEGQRTLGSLAGNAAAVVVGGHYRRGVAFSGCNPNAATDVARYSSRGSGRAGTVPGPDLVAPSDESPLSHGLRAAGNHSGATVRMDGTSVAAPLVTRRIVNLLAANPAGSVKNRLVPLPNPDPQHAGSRGQMIPGQEP